MNEFFIQHTAPIIDVVKDKHILKFKKKKKKRKKPTLLLYCFRIDEHAPISQKMLCEKQLSAGILMRLPYQQRPAQPIFISALLATSCLDAMNNDILDIIIVWNNE